jgi:aminomethyltransferase
MSFVSSALTKASRNTTRSVVRRTLATASSEPLVKTSLNELHKELGADMVPFAGYELPVLYKGTNGGVMKEHLWCREAGKSALFDVSHMGQVRSSRTGLTQKSVAPRRYKQ